jgi:WD40 repeat protein
MVLAFGGLMLLGMAGAGGAVYWFMRGQPGSGAFAGPVGTTDPGPTQPEPTGRTTPPDAGREKPPDGPKPEAKGKPVEVTVIDKGGADEPDQAPATPGALKALPGSVQRVAYSPEGTKLAAVYSYSQNGVASQAVPRVVLWDLATRESTQLLEGPGPGLVFFSADGKTLLTGSHEQAGIYDVATGAGKATFAGELVAASADGRTLVTKLPRSKYAIYDVPSGKEVLNFEEQSGGYMVAVSPDGKLVAMDVKQEVRLFDVAAGKELPRFQASPSRNVESLFFPDATLLLVGTGDSIALWDVGDRTGRPQLRQRADEGGSGPTLSPDRKTVSFIRGGYAQLRLWDIPAWKLRTSIPSCRGSETFSGEGKTVAAYDNNNGVLVADAATGQVRQVVPAEKWSSFGLSPDGKQLALGTAGGAIHLRAVAGGGPVPAGVKELASLPFPPNTKNVGGSADDRLFITPDGRFVVVRAEVPVASGIPWNYVACNLADRTLSAGFYAYGVCSLLDPQVFYSTTGDTEQLINLATGKTLERPPAKPGQLYDRLLLSPDAKTLAASLTNRATGKDPAIALVNPANGQVLAVLLDKASASRFAFSPDGKLLAACADTGAFRVKLWDLAGKAEVPTVAEHARTGLAFADNGKWLVAIDGDVLHAYETSPAQTEKKVELRRGHTGGVNAITCSPTAPLLASVGANGEALLRDLTTGEVRARLPGHTGNVTAVGFTPDGKRLVTAGEDNLLKLWEIGDLPPAVEPAAGPAAPAPSRPRPGQAFPFQLHEYATFSSDKAEDGRGYLRFSRDGNVVAAGYNKYRVWDLATKALKYPTTGDSDRRGSGESWLSPDGRHLMYYAVDDSGTANWLATTDLAAGTVRQEPLSKRFAGALAFAPDGKAVAIGHHSKGAEGNILTVLELPSLAEKVALTAFDARVVDVGYTPDGSALFASIQDREGTRLVQLDPATLKQRAELGPVEPGVLLFSPDSKLLANQSKREPNFRTGPAVVIWDVAAGKVRTRIPNAGEVSFFVPDAGLFVTGGSSSVTASDVNTGQERLRLDLYNDRWKEAGKKSGDSPTCYDLAVSADGRWVAIGDRAGFVYFWNLLRGKLAAKFKAHTGGVNGLAFSPDGRFLVTMGEEKKLAVWYLERLDSPSPAAP